MIRDLDSKKYDGFLQLIVECLRYSPLVITLTKSECLPLVHLSKAFSISSYQKREEMGYKESISAISKFKKPNLPPMWNGLFTLLFKSFSKWVTGSDCASKLFMTLILIPEVMLRDIPTPSKTLQAYRSFPLSGFRPLTNDMRKVLEEADKPKMGGKKKGMKVGVSQSEPPFLNDSTTITTTFTIDPPVTINTFDTGASASGFTVGHIFPTISPFRQDDPDAIFGGDYDHFTGFTYSPFNIQTKSDDEAPVTRGQLNAINEKLDLLL
ncbi:unnamed protein product [Lactuca saligna]|uniref:Uncharacterized protein n=1 Tax=Lactuca saligna TaxID=75948 RepID=A0AA36A2V9_LACSI|nr:unnamed protein product [Lactuca saligna]